MITGSLFPYVALAFILYGQYCLHKTIEQVRHFKLPIVTFPEDVLALMKIDDEAEWEAYYEQSFSAKSICFTSVLCHLVVHFTSIT